MRLVDCGFNLNDLFDELIEQIVSTYGLATIEVEGELIQVIVQMMLDYWINLCKLVQF